MTALSLDRLYSRACKRSDDIIVVRGVRKSAAHVERGGGEREGRGETGWKQGGRADRPNVCVLDYTGSSKYARCSTNLDDGNEIGQHSFFSETVEK